MELEHIKLEIEDLEDQKNFLEDEKERIDKRIKELSRIIHDREIEETELDLLQQGNFI